MNKKGVTRKIVILSIFIVAFLITAVYFTFFFHYSCDTLGCFKSHQLECVRTKFISETDLTTWSYRIAGEQDGKCIIETEILQIKEGSLDRKSLEGKSMECALRLGSIDLPEGDLTLCHGRLKEDIQEIMIKNTHSQILSNLEDELKGLI